MTGMRSIWKPMAVLAILGLVLASCGGESTTTAGAAEATVPQDQTTETETGPSTSGVATVGETEAPATTMAAPSVEAYCEQWLATDTLVGNGPQGDPAAWAAESIAALESAKSNAPEEIAEPVAVMADAVTPAIEAGDEEQFFAAAETEEFMVAQAEVDGFLSTDCGWNTVAVVAKDFEFDADFESLTPGVVGFEFDNQGMEMHEMVVMRINDDTTESLEELLALPEEEAMSKTTFLGAAFAAPGESDTMFVDLEQGRYAVLCFIPTGTTPEKMEAMESGDAEGGPPHFVHGMSAEFTIEG